MTEAAERKVWDCEFLTTTGPLWKENGMEGVSVCMPGEDVLGNDQKLSLIEGRSPKSYYSR